MNTDITHLGLYETDPQDWSLIRLQCWIKEAEEILKSVQSSRDHELHGLSELIACERRAPTCPYGEPDKR